MRGANVTAELVEKVRRYKAKYPAMTNVDIAEVCGTSETTVRKIMSGGYDHLEGKAPTGSDIGKALCSIAASLSLIEAHLSKLDGQQRLFGSE